LVTNEGVNTAGISGTTGYANINTIYADYNQNNTLPSQPAGVIVEGGNQTCAQGTIGYAYINTIYAGYNRNNTLPPQGMIVTTNAMGAAAIRLIAENIAFNMSTITVPAGAAVTIYFSNPDNGIPHNSVVYTDSSAANQIFKGATITGPSATTYTFTAPTTSGAYFFRCDVHTTQMTGCFVVTSAGTAGTAGTTGTTMTSGTNASQSSGSSGSSGYI
jgi:plastocyanin